MSDIEPCAQTPVVNWSELGVSGLLPTGTVTLLLADVEGSTRLWETQPEEMTAAIARLDRTVSDVVAAHHGVRPVKQGEGDSFVVAFTRASNAVACALELQRAPLAPIRLRIGVLTGEDQLRDLPRRERVVQLCHPDLRNDFPPLRTSETVVAQHLPTQFTSFVGREAEMNDVRQILANNRLGHLPGPGGV